MKKVNLSIGDDLLRQSKIAASHVDLSLSAVVRMLLDGFVKSVEAPADLAGSYRKLLDFSLGRITSRKLMSELQIGSDEALFLMMCRAGLPMPMLPKAELAKMEKILDKCLS